MSAFWGQGVRRKIGGSIDGEMLESEVFSEGIRFYRQGEGSRLAYILTWRQIVTLAKSREPFPVEFPSGPNRIEFVPEGE